MKVTIASDYSRRDLLDHQKVGQRVVSLLKGKRQLSRKELLSDARDATSPLHPAFEWDDGKAAEEYRGIQADQLMKAITVVVEKRERDDEKPKSYRVAIVPERLPDETVYVSRISAQVGNQDATSFQRAMQSKMIEDLMQFKRKYGHLDDARPVIEVIDLILQQREAA